MALSARYDPRQDRMRLTLEPAEGAARCFWLTRRQWMAWLHTIKALSRSLPADALQPDEQRVSLPRRRPQSIAAGVLEPETLKAIRLRRLREKVAVLFIGDNGQISTLTLAPEGARQLEGLLDQQAERAGWDASAALARLDAAAIATATVGRARRLH